MLSSLALKIWQETVMTVDAVWSSRWVRSDFEREGNVSCIAELVSGSQWPSAPISTDSKTPRLQIAQC